MESSTLQGHLSQEHDGQSAGKLRNQTPMGLTLGSDLALQETLDLLAVGGLEVVLALRGLALGICKVKEKVQRKLRHGKRGERRRH